MNSYEDSDESKEKDPRAIFSLIHHQLWSKVEASLRV